MEENETNNSKQPTNIDNVNNNINYEDCNTNVNDRSLAKDSDVLNGIQKPSKVRTLSKTNEVYFSDGHKKRALVSDSELPINTDLDFKKKVKTKDIASERLRNSNKPSRKDIMELYDERVNNPIVITDIVKNKEEAINLNISYINKIKTSFSRQLSSPSKYIDPNGYHTIYEDFNPYNLHPIFTIFQPEDEMAVGMYILGDLDNYHVQFNFNIKGIVVPAIIMLVKTTYHLYLNIPESLYFGNESSKAKAMYKDENCTIVSNLPSSNLILESIKEFSTLDPNLKEDSFGSPEHNDAFVYYSTQLINRYITKAYYRYI